MKRFGLAAIAILLLASTAFAADLPPGKWWRRAEIVTRLSLTEDQQNKLEDIFRKSANDLIDLRGAVEKENIALRGELDSPQLNRQSIQRIANRLSDARSRLFERELMMLVDMRGVLTETQWNTMRSELDRLNGNPQQRQMMRPNPRRQR
jgi:Spy/CpxP family protein refolding chaperone